MQLCSVHKKLTYLIRQINIKDIAVSRRRFCVSTSAAYVSGCVQRVTPHNFFMYNLKTYNYEQRNLFRIAKTS